MGKFKSIKNVKELNNQDDFTLKENKKFFKYITVGCGALSIKGPIFLINKLAKPIFCFDTNKKNSIIYSNSFNTLALSSLKNINAKEIDFALISLHILN